jgi:hypothetical protein
MSVRRTNFGSRPSPPGKSLGHAIDLTREHLARQSMDAPFHVAPQTRQWSCGCGGVNSDRHERCRWCREARR